MSIENKKLYRSRSKRMVGGVCGGLGVFFAIDPTLVRLVFVFGLIFGFGSMLFVYLVMLFIVPEEPLVTNPPSEPPSQTTQS